MCTVYSRRMWLQLHWNHRVDREAFSPAVGIGTPPTPHPQASVPPPPLVPGGGAHSLARDGVGESQFRWRDIHCGTHTCTVTGTNRGEGVGPVGGMRRVKVIFISEQDFNSQDLLPHPGIPRLLYITIQCWWCTNPPTCIYCRTQKIFPSTNMLYQKGHRFPSILWFFSPRLWPDTPSFYFYL